MIHRYVAELDNGGDDITLSSLEAFCRMARQQGGSNDDVIKARVSFRGTLRKITAVIELGHNREAAYRKDQGDAF